VGLESKSDGGQARFAAYVEAITMTLGHADRAAPFRSYCAGLLLPGDRKSVEPMAARVQPERVRAAHQSLHHFVAKADWSDDAVLSAVRAHVLPAIERRGSIRGCTGILATIGSTAPFVGLFGTVWGIMNSGSPGTCVGEQTAEHWT
jgi:SRSO17 transposase